MRNVKRTWFVDKWNICWIADMRLKPSYVCCHVTLEDACCMRTNTFCMKENYQLISFRSVIYGFLMEKRWNFLNLMKILKCLQFYVKNRLETRFCFSLLIFLIGISVRDEWTVPTMLKMLAPKSCEWWSGLMRCESFNKSLFFFFFIEFEYFLFICKVDG